LLSLGVYPDVSLKAARERRDDLRQQLASGIDPSVKRKAEKTASTDTFKAVAREWFTQFSANWAKNHSLKILRRLEKDPFPWLGSLARARSAKSPLLSCSPACVGLSRAARSRPPTGRIKTAGRSSVMQSQQGEQNVTRLPARGFRKSIG
jgi:hypothetical protein